MEAKDGASPVPARISARFSVGEIGGTQHVASEREPGLLNIDWRPKVDE